MKSVKEKFLLLFADFAALNLAYLASYLLRYHSGIFANFVAPEFRLLFWPSLIISCGWMVIFLLFGMYRSHTGISAEQLLFETAKVSLGGIFIIFFLTLDLKQPFSPTRLVLLSYWGILISFVYAGRVILRRVLRQPRVEITGANNLRIEVFPDILVIDDAEHKGLVDNLVSLIIFLLGFPFWVLVRLLVNLDRKGPTFDTERRYEDRQQNRPGRVKGGK
ncbi:MAG: hypothetical protein NTW14_12855 [bacterium]|nr:hypothetical protein [bacterium]